MRIKEETVKHVAKLARIELSAAEVHKFEKDLNEIIESFKVIDSAPNAEPSFQPILMQNVLREDEPEKCLSQDAALANTKHKERGFFKGPKAV